MQEYIEFFQQNMILSLAWVGIFIALVMSTIKSANAKYRIISTSETTHLINRMDGIVVDIRTNDEFQKGHIIDAVHILPSDIKAGSLQKLEKSKSAPIIVVCNTGLTAQENANLLIAAGFENVNVLKSGLLSWREANLPLVRR